MIIFAGDRFGAAAFLEPLAEATIADFLDFEGDPADDFVAVLRLGWRVDFAAAGLALEVLERATAFGAAFAGRRALSLRRTERAGM
jgi:hypothetical protein